MIKLNKFIILFLFFVSQMAFAEVTGKFCIKSIDKFTSIVQDASEQDPMANPLIVWDFDDTLFSKGKFREGDKTKKAITILSTLNSKHMILTARLQGRSAKNSEAVKEALNESLGDMKETINLFGGNAAIESDVIMEFNYPDSIEYMLVRGPAVFAGAGFSGESNKAMALKELITSKKIMPPPSHVFMIDDTATQLTPFTDVFASSPVKVYLIHYPTPSYGCADGFQVVE